MNKHLSSIKKTAVLVAVSWLAIPAFAGIGGFVDAQVGGSKTVNPNSEIADAAVYLTKELGNGKLMIDIPFSYRADSVDTSYQLDSAGGGPDVPNHTAGFASAFRSFNKKAQATVSWSYDFGLSWTLGRFDSPFLNEAQDTVGLGPYATQGAIFNVLPNMHNGLMLTYGQGPLSVMGIVSRPVGLVHSAPSGNPADAPARQDGENFEWGFLAKYTHDMMYAGAGLYLFNTGTKDAPSVDPAKTFSLIEIMAGTKVADWTIDAQAVLTSPIVKNTDSGLAVGATINYAMDKMWSIGIRPNYVNKINPNTVATTASPAWYVASAGSTWEVTVGPQAQMTDDLRLRLNYTWTSTKANPNTKSETDSAYALSAVYKF